MTDNVLSGTLSSTLLLLGFVCTCRSTMTVCRMLTLTVSHLCRRHGWRWCRLATQMRHRQVRRHSRAADRQLRTSRLTQSDWQLRRSRRVTVASCHTTLALVSWRTSRGVWWTAHTNNNRRRQSPLVTRLSVYQTTIAMSPPLRPCRVSHCDTYVIVTVILSASYHT